MLFFWDSAVKNSLYFLSPHFARQALTQKGHPPADTRLNGTYEQAVGQEKSQGKPEASGLPIAIGTGWSAPPLVWQSLLCFLAGGILPLQNGSPVAKRLQASSCR
jgi:hypothetical protein